MFDISLPKAEGVKGPLWRRQHRMLECILDQLGCKKNFIRQGGISKKVIHGLIVELQSTTSY